AKFAGVRFHGKYQAGQAYRESKMQEDYSRSLAYENPVLFNKAVERCKKKKYALTPFNILTEVYKIEKEEKNASPSFSYTSQVKDKLSKLISTVKTDNSSDTLEKLERLTELYNEGIITKEELTSIKKEIIK
ncbi:MAG: hypothetical protein GYA51_18505, partial [Candidatus Methanofastidiosa archaeon]|nr:hypothetical protein [Candidatus Methanofastidiosa archaeon]